MVVKNDREFRARYARLFLFLLLFSTGSLGDPVPRARARLSFTFFPLPPFKGRSQPAVVFSSILFLSFSPRGEDVAGGKKRREREKREPLPNFVDSLDKFGFLFQFDDSHNFARNYPRQGTILKSRDGEIVFFFPPPLLLQKKEESSKPKFPT